MHIKLGTRKSPLALAQAQQVRMLLLKAHPHITVEIVHIVTSGDKFLSQNLADIGGKGLFTKEIEEGLLGGSLDIAVHSMKDMPTKLPDGLIIGAMLEREDPRDMLIGAGLKSIGDLPQEAVFGTSSLRRAAQVKIRRPDIKIVPFRGNVQSRLAKLERGEVRATMLAKAGLNRLGIHDVEGVVLAVEEFLPAIAQGAIGIECRENDTKIRELLAPLAHTNTMLVVDCERAFLRVLDGSCRTPISGYAMLEGDGIFMRGLIAKPDGSSFKSGELRGSAIDAEAIGVELGKMLSNVC
ncbi:MAG: hydroxymethylbilane synthase [Rickettsiales bacterium]